MQPGHPMQLETSKIIKITENHSQTLPVEDCMQQQGFQNALTKADFASSQELSLWVRPYCMLKMTGLVTQMPNYTSPLGYSK